MMNEAIQPIVKEEKLMALDMFLYRFPDYLTEHLVEVRGAHGEVTAATSERDAESKPNYPKSVRYCHD